MGWTVLYIAFGIVALWLLGEVLLQYKARLRWRLLAFGGFLGVVLGVLIPSVLVIALGAIAFATGQTYVTLSFRRGFSTGWALGGSPNESRRRRRGASAEQKPVLEVSDLEYEGQPAPEPFPSPSPSQFPDGEPAPAAVYETQPMPDETGQYGIYTDPAPAAGGQQPQYAAYDPYGGYGQQPAQDDYAGQGGYPSQDTYQAQGTYTGHYDYGQDRTDGPAHSDPYAGDTGGTGQYAAYDNAAYDNTAYGTTAYENVPYGNQADDNAYGTSYGTGQHQPADPYAGYSADTPPGGVWVPQQRETDQYPPLPPEESVRPAPYGNGYDTGQNEQYRN